MAVWYIQNIIIGSEGLNTYKRFWLSKKDIQGISREEIASKILNRRTEPRWPPLLIYKKIFLWCQKSTSTFAYNCILAYMMLLKKERGKEKYNPIIITLLFLGCREHPNIFLDMWDLPYSCNCWGPVHFCTIHEHLQVWSLYEEIFPLHIISWHMSHDN